MRADDPEAAPSAPAYLRMSPLELIGQARGCLADHVQVIQHGSRDHLVVLNPRRDRPCRTIDSQAPLPDVYESLPLPEVGHNWTASLRMRLALGVDRFSRWTTWTSRPRSRWMASWTS